MNGLWRPFALYGGAIFSPWAYAYIKTKSLGAPGSLAFGFLFLCVIVAMVVGTRAYGVARFLAGMRDGGQPMEILDSEIGWMGGRTVRARTPQGEWRIEFGGGKGSSLEILAPGQKEAREADGKAYDAGLAAAKRARGMPS